MQKEIKSVTLTALAAHLKYSSVYTGTLLKRLTGKTFSAYLQDLRCQRAAHLLLERDLAVKEVIQAVGYENESFFRKIFKEKYGKNPLQYRKER